ncbi:MAG TPA: hypothetical protein VFC71_11640 [Candidatus Polarisedimenticolia bacterium]|nr:hypothetical protein [Candidatus Polarisedimenticolia bacterium]
MNAEQPPRSGSSARRTTEGRDGPSPEPPRGYRAGARVESGGERAAFVTLITGAVLLVAVGVAVFDPVIPGPSVAPDLNASPGPTPRLAATLPPLQIADVGAPSQPLAMLAGGLRWLDPRTGRLSGTPYEAFEGAPFINPDGSLLCLCIERPWQQHGATARVAVVRSSGPDEASERTEVVTLETAVDDRFGSSISFETALSPDRSTFFVSTLVRQEAGYEAALLAVDATSGLIRARTEIPLPAGEGGPPFATLRVAPVGAVRLTIWSTPIGQEPDRVWAAHAFEVPTSDAGFGAPAVVPPIDAATSGPVCFGEAYVGPSLYGGLCTLPDDPFASTSLVTAAAAGSSRLIGLPGSLTGRFDAAIDAAGSRVFLWSPATQTLVRVDARTGAVVSRTYPTNSADAPHLTLPDPGPATVVWSRFSGAQDVYTHSTIVGSADGALMYAIGGSEDDSSGLRPSSGVLVIDTSTLDLLDAWAPTAYYNDIAATADDTYLVGLGLGGVDTLGQPARWQDSITYHRLRDGKVVEVIGAVDGLRGWTPVLLQGPG